MVEPEQSLATGKKTRWDNPGERARQSELMLQSWRDPEFAADRVDSIRRGTRKPGYRASYQTEEYRQKRSVVQTELWLDPAYRDTHLAAYHSSEDWQRVVKCQDTFRPFFMRHHLRGAGNHDIARVEGVKVQKVTDYRRHLRKVGLLPPADPNTLNEQRSATLKQLKKALSPEEVRAQLQSTEFTKKLLAQGFFTEDLSSRKRAEAIIQSQGCNIPSRYEDQLRFEAWTKALEEAHRGNGQLLSTYQSLGEEVGPNWLTSSKLKGEVSVENCFRDLYGPHINDLRGWRTQYDRFVQPNPLFASEQLSGKLGISTEWLERDIVARAANIVRTARAMQSQALPLREAHTGEGITNYEFICGVMIAITTLKQRHWTFRQLERYCEHQRGKLQEARVQAS